MEFFQEIDAQDLTADWIKQKLTIGDLANRCASIDRVIEDHISSGKVYCVWGTFKVNREEIVDGVRFTLPHCPNALAWTVTHDPKRQKIVVHCTIDKHEHSDDFVDSIQQFVVDWQDGLRRLIA